MDCDFIRNTKFNKFTAQFWIKSNSDKRYAKEKLLSEALLAKTELDINNGDHIKENVNNKDLLDKISAIINNLTKK